MYIRFTMKKQDAIDLFGSVRQLAYALEISVQAVYLWPEDLSKGITARVKYALFKRNMEQLEKQFPSAHL